MTRRRAYATGLLLCSMAVAVHGQSVGGSTAREAPAESAADERSVPWAAREPVSFGDLTLTGQPAGPAPTPRHTGVRAMMKDLAADVKHLPSMENLYWAGLGGGLALAVHPADDDLNEALVGDDIAGKIFKPGAVLGELYTLLGSATTVYIVGRTKDQPKVSHVGMDLIQSLLISEGITQGLKYATHRERPDGSGATSFPSGHAADTFAFATALERHLGWKGAVPAYIFSSYVAISRLPANRHWFSDTVFGATVGIIAGRTVTRHGTPFPVTIASVPGGMAIVYVKPHRPELPRTTTAAESQADHE